MELLGLGTALKILFTKDVLTVDMFERNELLSLIVTLGKYSDALQFIEDMEEQIAMNKLKKNIQGYVDIDNQQKEDTSSETVNRFDDKTFDKLISNSFETVFKLDQGNICKDWKLFCGELKKQNLSNIDSEKLRITKNICNVRDDRCVEHQTIFR